MELQHKTAHADPAEDERIIHTMGTNNCGGRCIIHVHMKGGKIDRLTTDTPEAAGDAVPLTACARGLNYHRTFLSEDRLLYPMKRTGERGEGKFERISWEEAVDITAREWIRIRDQYGAGSRYVNYATGVSGLLSGESFAKRLMYLDGGCLGYYNSYSSACIAPVTKMMYGTTESGNPPSTWLDSRLIILWAHNPLETKFDCETMYYLREAKKKGIPIISVDPRYNDTAAALGAEWIPVRPATDSALLDAMAYVILTEGFADRDFLNRCCLGFDDAHMPRQDQPGGTSDPRAGKQTTGVGGSSCIPGISSDGSYISVESWLLGRADGTPKTPEWAEGITGVPAETIRSLAVRYASAKPAALIQGYGAQRHAFGEQSARGGILLACMTGNVGISGGWACGTADCTRHQWPAFPMPPNPYGRKIPSYCWTGAVERGEIRMMVNLAGNCLINQHGDINRTAELLRDTSKCEFILASDLFMTASAKFADILLPGVSMFECDNIAMPWKYGDFLGFSRQCIPPLGECRPEYDWLCEVAERLGLRDVFSQGKSWGDWLRTQYEELRRTERELPDFDEFREAGIYRYRNHPRHIAFEEQRRDPENHPFPTPSGKIELFSPAVAASNRKLAESGASESETFPAEEYFPPIPGYAAPPEGPQDSLRERYPLQLIGWHSKNRCHSIHNNNPALRRADPQVLWIHPEDAAARGIADGDTVVVYNDRGTVEIPARVTDRIMRGVTAMPQGAWYRPAEAGAECRKSGEEGKSGSMPENPAEEKRGTDTSHPVDWGGCINTLTSLRTTPWTHGNTQHTNLVQVKK